MMVFEESKYYKNGTMSPSKLLVFRQLFWNLSSRTPVYKRYVYGVQLPTSDVYKRITAKQVKLIGGSMVGLGEEYEGRGDENNGLCVNDMCICICVF